MKKTVYTVRTCSMNGRFIDLELKLDIGRDLVESENDIISENISKMITELTAEYRRLDPIEIEKRKEEKEAILSIFNNQLIFTKEIPNEYGGINPWFLITTVKGPIKIGWRHRVINIDWEDSIIEGSADELFPLEDTTRYHKSIHAWGYQKAGEYVNLLLKS